MEGECAAFHCRRHRAVDGSGADVYTRNDSSPKGYTHDFVSSDGKITKYYDFIMMNLNYGQMLYATEEECLETATEVLQQSSGAKTLTKRMFQFNVLKFNEGGEGKCIMN